MCTTIWIVDHNQLRANDITRRVRAEVPDCTLILCTPDNVRQFLAQNVIPDAIVTGHHMEHLGNGVDLLAELWDRLPQHVLWFLNDHDLQTIFYQLKDRYTHLMTEMGQRIHLCNQIYGDTTSIFFGSIVPNFLEAHRRRVNRTP